MKKLMSLLIIAALFCSHVYTQDAKIQAEQPVDFAKVEQTQDLKYAFVGQYHVDPGIDKMASKKMSATGAGALIGLGLGTLGGLAVGIAGASTTNDPFSEPFEPFYIGMVTGLGALVGTSVGALLGLAIDSSNNKKKNEPVDQDVYKYHVQDVLVMTNRVPQVQIISLSHSF